MILPAILEAGSLYCAAFLMAPPQIDRDRAETLSRMLGGSSEFWLIGKLTMRRRLNAPLSRLFNRGLTSGLNGCPSVEPKSEENLAMRNVLKRCVAD